MKQEACGCARVPKDETDVFMNMIHMASSIPSPARRRYRIADPLGAYIGEWEGERRCRTSTRTGKRFDHEALRALLHSWEHELTVHRLWHAFLGTVNVIVTSWVPIGVWDIDFGCGAAAYVKGDMPAVDGCVQIMEDGRNDKSGKHGGGDIGQKPKLTQ